MTKPKKNLSLRKVQQGFTLILEGLGMGDDPHTKDTAKRAARAWMEELCAGLLEPLPRITTFPSDVQEMIVLREIPVRSLCAHHLLPFVGTASVGYISESRRILGLSKLSRLTNYYARRPQVQEELTKQVADHIAELVQTGKIGGVGVVIRANHMCMECRGVNHKGDMITSALRGSFKDSEVRAEFLRLAGY